MYKESDYNLHYHDGHFSRRLCATWLCRHQHLRQAHVCSTTSNLQQVERLPCLWPHPQSSPPWGQQKCSSVREGRDVQYCIVGNLYRVLIINVAGPQNLEMWNFGYVWSIIVSSWDCKSELLPLHGNKAAARRYSWSSELQVTLLNMATRLLSVVLVSGWVHNLKHC